MKKLLPIIITLSLIHSVFALQINPSSWSVDASPGDAIQQTFYVINDQNTTVSISISTNSTWIWLSKTNIILAPFSSDSFDALLLVPSSASDGVYHFEISTNGNSIPVTLTIAKWVWNYTAWMEEGQYMFFDGTENGLKLMDVSVDEAQIGFVENGNVVGSMILGIGDYFEDQDFKIVLVDIFSNNAKIQVFSTSPHTVSIEGVTEQPTVQYFGGEFRFYTTEFGNTYVQGAKSTERFTLRNGLNESVELKSIGYEGTTIDENGVRKPIRVEHWSLVTLEPGQEKSFDVTIDTEGLEPGEYRCSFYVTGLGKRSNQIYTATVHFDIWVISKIKPSEEEAEFSINVPEEVEVDEEFTIEVTGLESTDTVMLYQIPEMVTTNIDRTSTTYTWTGKITKPGKYTIQISLIKREGIAIPYYKTINVVSAGEEVTNQTKIEIIPYPPKAGDTVSITTQPEAIVEITVYEGDQVVGKFFYSSPFKVDAGKKYCIKATAEGLEPQEQCFLTSKKRFKVSVTPSTPKVGDTIQVSVTNEDGSPVTASVTIKINDKTYNAPSASYDVADTSPINIQVSASGYETYSVTITPRKPVSIVEAPEEFKVGEENVIKLNRPALWEVRSGAEVIAYSTTQSDTIKFTPKEEGTVDVYVEGELLYSAEAKGALWSMPTLPSGFSAPTIVGIGILIFVGVIALLQLKKKFFPKKKLGYGFHVEKGPVKKAE